MKGAADALRRAGTASFRHGVAWETPELTERGLRGVGLFDCERRLTRVVEIWLPDSTLDVLRARRSRNPLSNLGFKALSGVLERVSEPTESRLGAGAVSVREAGDEWMDMPMPEGERRRIDNHPGWLIDLLDAAAEALLDRRDQATADGGLRIEARLDLHLVWDVLPGQLAKRVTSGDQKKGTERSVPFVCELRADGLPSRVAVSEGLVTGTGERLWAVLEFTAFGEPFDEVDLWARWRAASAPLAIETSP